MRAALFNPILGSKRIVSKVAASSLEAVSYRAGTYTAEGCDAHVDNGVLTCIYADKAQGFQVV